MVNMSEGKKDSGNYQVFKRRLDFYWQFVAVYAVVLVIYAVLRRMVFEGNFFDAVVDPVSILFSVFIVIALLSVMFQEIERKEIHISDDHFILKTRFREKNYTLDDIRRISFSKDRRIRIKKPVRVIKIALKNRRFPVKIRPSAFWDDRNLVQALIKLRQNMKPKS